MGLNERSTVVLRRKRVEPGEYKVSAYDKDTDALIGDYEISRSVHDGNWDVYEMTGEYRKPIDVAQGRREAMSIIAEHAGEQWRRLKAVVIC